MYVSLQITETINTDTSKINSGEVLKSAIDQEIITDITKDDVSINIDDIIKDISNKDKEYIVVYKGEICYVSNANINNNEKQVKWCKDLGIRILEYTEPEGILVKNGKYELVEGDYLCTPMLDEGFNKNNTFYVTYDQKGNEHSVIPAINNPPLNWYNYGDSKWANIVVRNENGEIYYTWIPRYCFKLDQTNKKSDVKFIDTENNYKNSETGEVILWETLESQGYQIPEAFTFAEKDLPGYWIMKYNIGNVGTALFDAELTASETSIKVNGVTGTSVTDGQIYNYYINGVEKGNKISAEEKFEYEGLLSGQNYVVVIEIRNRETDEYIGVVTKNIKTTKINKPDLSGFEETVTYYVLYDKEGNETIGERVKKDGSNMPNDWYNYGESRWANIVIKGKDDNGNETSTYFTWIPRYQFKLDQQNKKSIVEFIDGKSNKPISGYQIPEAFTFNGVELTGYWIMKYNIGN